MPSYEIDAYSASKANMAMLPEMMQLGQLQQMRQGIEQNEFELRKMGREENAAFQEADEFGQFEDVVKNTAGMSPIEQSKAIQDSLTQNPSWTNNTKIKNSLSSIQQGRRDQVQAGVDEIQMENFGDIKETARITAKNNLNAALKAQSDFQSMVDNQQLKNSFDLGSYLGSSGRVLPIQTRDKIIEAANTLSADPSSEGLLTGLGKVVSGFSGAEGLLSTYGSELSEYKPILASAQQFGINLDIQQSEEEFKASYERAMEFARDPKNGNNGLAMGKAAALANKANALYGQISFLKDDLDSGLQKLNLQDREAVKVFVSQWNMRSGQLSGNVNQELVKKDNFYKQQDRDLDMRKKVAELRAIPEKTANERERIRISKNKAELAEYLAGFKETEARTRIFSMLDEEMDLDKRLEETNRIFDDLRKTSSLGGTKKVNLLD